MGTWTIYSLGDAAFLEQIFIAVAMVTGTGDFTKAAAIALLFAVLIYFFQSLLKGAQNVNIGQLLTGWILFMCMFYPTTTVVIEDGVTGSVRVVSNVPLGMGAIGGMTSSIGYGLTVIFEQAYGYIAPGVTESHFVDSLVLLNKIRAAGSDSRVIEAINANLPNGSDYRGSWDNYIRECTLRKIDLGLSTLDDILSTPLPEALRFDSTLYGTQIYLNGATGQNLTCSQAYSELRSIQNSLKGTFLSNSLSEVLQSNPSSGGYGYYNVFDEIAGALQALSLSSQDAYAYVEASILEPIYQEAVLGKYQDLQDFSSAIMINEALQQRNVQWASEQTLFMTTIRPLQTFFEGLVYALTPLIGILIIMGGFGLSLAGKYLQILFWIQLWLPALSIINLYIYTAASNALASYNNPNFGSIYSLMGVNDVLQHWIGVGAMLAASTPMIAFFLVSGSTYAMTGLAGRISGADHIKEQTTTPDIVQQGAYMANQAMHTNNPMIGSAITGAEATIGSASIGNTFSDSVASSQEKLTQAQQSFNQSLSRIMSSIATDSQSMQLATSLGQTINSSNTQGAATIRGLANDYMKTHNISEQHRDAVMGAIAMGASVGATAGGHLGAKVGGENQQPSAEGVNVPQKDGINASGQLGASGGVNLTGSATSSTETSGADLFTRASSFAQNLSLSDEERSTITDSVAGAIQATQSSNFTHALGDSAANSLQESAIQLTSAKDAYTQTSQAANQAGSAYNMKFSTLAGLMVGPSATTLGKEALKDLNSYFNSGQASSEVQQSALRKENAYRQLGMSPHMAQATARLEAMSDATNYSSTQAQAEGMKAVSGIMSKALGGGASQVVSGDATANANIETPNFDRGELQKKVQAANSPSRELSVPATQNTGGATGDVNAAFNSISGNLPTGVVTGHHNQGLNQTYENYGYEAQYEQAQSRSQAIDQMRDHNAKYPTQASQFFNGNEKAIQMAKALFGSSASIPYFDSAMNNSVGQDTISDPNYHGIAHYAQTNLGLPSDQAAYYAYRATGGNDPAVRNAFVQGLANHITPEEGAVIANTIENVAAADPKLSQGYLNPLHQYNASADQSRQVQAKTGVAPGFTYTVNISGSGDVSSASTAAPADQNDGATQGQPMEPTVQPDGINLSMNQAFTGDSAPQNQPANINDALVHAFNFAKANNVTPVEGSQVASAGVGDSASITTAQALQHAVANQEAPAPQIEPMPPTTTGEAQANAPMAAAAPVTMATQEPMPPTTTGEAQANFSHEQVGYTPQQQEPFDQASADFSQGSALNQTNFESQNPTDSFSQRPPVEPFNFGEESNFAANTLDLNQGSGLSSGPELNEQEIRQDEANKYAMQQYWRPEKPAPARNFDDYPEESAKSQQRPIPKRPDSV